MSSRQARRWNPSKRRKSYYGSRRRTSRNPGGKAHTAYGQHIFKLGFPINDPIVELGSVWAGGVVASAQLIGRARLSAERWMEARDKRLRSAARAVYNKLTDYLKHQERAEYTKPKYGPGTLTSHGHRNPGSRRRARKERGWQRKVKDSLPWWEKGRRNPFQESWHVQQEIRGARKAKRSGRKSRHHLSKLSRSGRSKVVSSMLGQMNPKSRRGRRR